MILFHAKRDGTVTTTPNFVPQGSSMQDLVVVSEFDYACCAIRLLPASGEYIEDIPCNFILQKDLSTIFTAALPPKATVVAGSVDYQLIFTAADGTTQTTLVGSFTVPRGVPVSTPPTVGELSAKTVADLYSILDNIYSLFAGHEGDIVKNNENIADLIRFKSSAGTVTIPMSEWTDSAPTMASVEVSGVDMGSIILMLPADEKTRLTANNAKLSAYPTAFTPVGGDSSVSIFRAEAETVPDSDMTFAYIVLKTGFSFATPVAAIVGVDAYGEGGGGSGGGGVDSAAVEAIVNRLVPSWAMEKNKPTYDKDDVGLGNVENKRQYSESNPPPYPVKSVNGKTGAVSLSASDVGARPNTWMPTAADVGARPSSWTPTASDVGADERGAAQAVADKVAEDLKSYYKKSETYGKDEINNMISSIPKFTIQPVNSLPTTSISTTTVYLLKDKSDSGDLYTEYIYVNGAWEELGRQKVNLTGYVTEGTLTDALKSYALSSSVPTKLSQLEGDSTHRTVTDTEKAAWNNKVDQAGVASEVEAQLTAAKESGDFDGERGPGILNILGGLESYKTPVGGITPAYRILISKIKENDGVTDVIVGDTLRYSTFLYPVIYIDATYAYCAARVTIQGAPGTPGEAGAPGKDYSFDPTVYDLPVLYLTGDISPIKVSKDNEVDLTYVYGERSGTCKLKGQGSSSYQMAINFINAGKAGKFNYTIKFDNAFEAKEGWGSQKKYCLKANWIDHSHSRNVVSCKLWGMSVKARSTVPAELKNLPNGGAIDGFPVVIMLNNEFHGLYTFNIPKDGWMFGLKEDSTKTQAVFSAHQHSDATKFKGELKGDESDFELEFISDKNNTAWATASLNRLINACINSYGGDLDTEVAKYIDWDSAIDYYIHCVVEKGSDAVDKNFLLVTFDGTKWYFTNYDRDTICGLAWDGSGLDRPVSDVTFIACKDASRIFELIYRFKTDALKARYQQLRSNILSESRINQIYENFAWAIPSPVALEDVKKYPTIRGSFVNGIDQICRWMRQRLEACDKWINEIPAQETPVKPAVMVNQVPISTDTDGSIYNGTGYKDNARLSSSGGVSGSAQNGSVVTGFIPYTKDAIIRMKGAEWLNMSTVHSGHHFYLSFYNSSKTLASEGEGYVSSESYSGGNFGTWITYDATTGVTTFDTSKTYEFLKKIKNAAYFRINAYGKGADLVVTVNQEITE